MTRKPDDCDGGDDPDHLDHLGHDWYGCTNCGHAGPEVPAGPGPRLCGRCWWAAFVALRRPDSLRARRRSA